MTSPGTQLRMRSNMPVRNGVLGLGVVELGCMVSVATTFFDNAGDHAENRWSFGLFGNEWETARCMGKVI